MSSFSPLKLDKVTDIDALESRQDCLLSMEGDSFMITNSKGRIFPHPIPRACIESMAIGLRSPCAVVLWLRSGAAGASIQQILIEISGPHIRDNLCMYLKPKNIREYKKEVMEALVFELKYHARYLRPKPEDRVKEGDKAGEEEGDEADDKEALYAEDAGAKYSQANARQTHSKTNAKSLEYDATTPSGGKRKRSDDDTRIPDQLLESLKTCVDLVHQARSSGDATDSKLEKLSDENRELARALADRKARADQADEDRSERLKLERKMKDMKTKESRIMKENKLFAEQRAQMTAEMANLRASTAASRKEITDIKETESSLRRDIASLKDLFSNYSSLVDVEQFLSRTRTGEDVKSAYFAARKK